MLRKWQRKAIDTVRTEWRKKKHVLIAACPGAGKTRFTTALWQQGVAEGCDVICVIVPSRPLKRQWKKSFADAGFRAMDDVSNQDLQGRADQQEDMFDPDRPIQIYTYAQVAANADVFRALCSRHAVLAVFDEIHHADDEESYGESLVKGFELSKYILSLTGTPFNTKGGKLAFCQTDVVTDNDGRRLHRTKCDESYSYGEALSAEGTPEDPHVVRPVEFIRWNGRASWSRMYVDSGRVQHKSVDGSKKTDSLRPLLDMSGTSLLCRKMIDAAFSRLQEIRVHHANAAMLITAMNVWHAKEIQEYLSDKGIHDTKLIVHDTTNAASEIEEFRKSHERVLIAVKMISEGVDITRLRVGVYASDVTTQMFFIQFIGRFIRWDSSLPETQWADVFIPEHVTLIKYALEIEHMVMDAEDSIGAGAGGGKEQIERPSTITLDITTDGKQNGFDYRGGRGNEAEAAKIKQALIASGLVGKIADGEAQKFIRRFVELTPGAEEIMAPPLVPAETSTRKQNEKLVGAIVRESERQGRRMDFDEVNWAANKSVGISRLDKLTSEEILQRRLEFLKKLLVQFRRGTEGDQDAA